ncbi:MAG: HAD-IC family P-type ATPase [Olsenella sp.]|nr:HAD-IC family P-type ATPase [Olsenella sp.]
MEHESGLTSREVEELTRLGKANRLPSRSSDSVLRIVASNVFTYFNGIFALLAVLLVMVGSFKSLTFLPVIVANTIIGIVQQLRSKKVLDELALLDVSSYVALRDGGEKSVSSDALVRGDLVRLEGGQQVPADAVVVSGDATVNESLLTGEADEVRKREGAELRSGSFLVSGALVARLTRVGAESYAARLTAKAKAAKDRQSEMVGDIERIILVAGVLVVPVGGLLLWRSVAQSGSDLREAVTSMVGAVIGMIPEGLYLLVTIALALSAMRLAKRKVLLHDMRSIETLARVDVLCVDKTGTITSEDMVVHEVFVPAGSEAGELGAAEALLASYVRAVPDGNSTMRALRAYLPESDALSGDEVTPFSSSLKYSQIVMGSRTLRLGAPEFVLPNEKLEANRDALVCREGEGMRILAFVEGEGESARPLLFISLRNEVRPDAIQTFADFADRGVDVKVISGDNPLTVSSIAREAGIAGADRYVDASELVDPDALRAAARDYVVFGRVKPEQKRELVEALRADGLKVAMTGDGVNDILAMKEADCSIAMGGGSDAARQAAQVVLLDSDFSRMNQIVSEGRRDINNITRSATLFLYKNIFSLSLALFSIFGAFDYPLTPNQVSLISLFNIGLPAFLLAFEPNERKQEGHFISEALAKSLPAALTSFVAIAAMMLFAGLFEISPADVATASTYLLSTVGFLILVNLIYPANAYRLLVLALCTIGFVAGCGLFWQLFDIYNMSMRGWVLCGVFAFAEVGVIQVFEIVVQWTLSRFGRRV